MGDMSARDAGLTAAGAAIERIRQRLRDARTGSDSATPTGAAREQTRRGGAQLRASSRNPHNGSAKHRMPKGGRRHS